jgi:hypothetical protein
MPKFKRLLEQATRDDKFSPFFDTMKQMTDGEIEFLKKHDSEPSKTNTQVPPAQVEWQWQEGDLIYNCHLVKEAYNDDPRAGADLNDPSVAKRYKLMGFAYNKKNNLSGLVEDYTFISEEFNGESDLGVLESFLEDKNFLYQNDTSEDKIFSFSRPSDFEY